VNELTVTPNQEINPSPRPSEEVLSQLRGLGEPITSNIDSIAEDYTNFLEQLDAEFTKSQGMIDLMFWVFASGVTVPINPGSNFNTKFKEPKETIVKADNFDLQGVKAQK
jgi:hypothetical protein